MKRDLIISGRPLFLQAEFDREGWRHRLPNGNTHTSYLTIGRRSCEDCPHVRLFIFILGPLMCRVGWGPKA